MLSHAEVGGDPIQVLAASGQVWHLELKRVNQMMGSCLQRGPLPREKGRLSPERDHIPTMMGTGTSPRLCTITVWLGLGKKGLGTARRHLSPLSEPIS